MRCCCCCNVRAARLHTVGFLTPSLARLPTTITGCHGVLPQSQTRNVRLAAGLARSRSCLSTFSRWMGTHEDLGLAGRLPSISYPPPFPPSSHLHLPVLTCLPSPPSLSDRLAGETATETRPSRDQEADRRWRAWP